MTAPASVKDEQRELAPAWRCLLKSQGQAEVSSVLRFSWHEQLGVGVAAPLSVDSRTRVV